MAKKIALSLKTHSLIEKLRKARSLENRIANSFGLEDSIEEIELSKLVDWLSNEEALVLSSEDELEEDGQFLLASLNTALMKDLAKSLPNYKKKKKQRSNAGWSKHLKYGLLLFAGTIFFGSEGFDGITAIVGIFPLSAVTVFIIGTIFAFISVMTFYAFNLTEIAKNLEIEKKEAKKLVDRYLKEVEEINGIRRHLNNEFKKQKSSEEQEEDLVILELLITRYEALDEGRAALTKLRKNKIIALIKYGLAVAIGLIYFSSGFFAGQAVAVALAGLVLASTASLFWPILIISTVVGLAAFGVYWFVERPSIDNLIGCWFGFNQEKIECLCDRETIANDKLKLENLRETFLLRQAKLAQESEKRLNVRAQLLAAKRRIRELRTLLLNGHASPQIGRFQEDFQAFGFFSELPQAHAVNRSKLLALRPKTIALIEKLRMLGRSNQELDEAYDPETPESAKLNEVVNWLKHTNEPLQARGEGRSKDAQFVLASLSAALLKDLSKQMPDPKQEENYSNKTSKRTSWIYMTLAVAGTIYFGCEGFDGITSIISLFSAPKIAVFIVGSFFAAISILAFYAFDLAEISKNLGIKKKNVNKLVDVHLKEVKAINAIRRHLENEYTERTTVEELEEDLLITDLLISRYKNLDESRQSLFRLMTGKKLKILKYFVAAIIGIIYFSGGFFTGQAVALAIAGLFVASTASFFWPVLVVSFAIGLAALAVYWFVERPSIDKLVSRLCGFDQEKIERLCDAKKIEEHRAKLDYLKSNIEAYKNELIVSVQEELDCARQLEEANTKIKELEELIAETGPASPTISKDYTSLGHLNLIAAEGKQLTTGVNNFFCNKQGRSQSFSGSETFLSINCLGSNF